MKHGVFFAVCLVVWGSALTIAGCNPTQSSGSTAPAPSPNVDKGKQFLATLKAMPADKRQAYAAQHQEEVQNLTRAADPTLKTEFMNLMRPGAQ